MKYLYKIIISIYVSLVKPIFQLNWIFIPISDMRWTTLYENTYCDGTFGYERKKLSATNPEQCREAAENDRQCSNTMYYCSSSSAFHCRCVIKNQSCIKGSTSSLECTVERRGNTIVDKTKNFFALNTYKFTEN